LFVPVAGIAGIRALGLLIAQMLIHLGLHHLLDGSSKKILQGILDIGCRLDIVLLKELADDVPLSFCHLNVVDRFLLCSCHNNRPPMI
jgi:hypothetical protein